MPTNDASQPKEINPNTSPKVTPGWYWIRDAAGYKSVTTTLVFVSFWVTTIAYVLSMFDKIGPVTIRQFDVGACASFFTPILALYFSRKYTDAKITSDALKTSQDALKTSQDALKNNKE